LHPSARRSKELGGKQAGLYAQQAPIRDVIEGGPQAAMVVILKRHKAKWLQHAIGHLAHGSKNLGHTVHRACLGLKGNFDEVTLAQRLGHLQQATGHGNSLEFSFCAAAIFETNRSQDRIT
jgi:hypothetical protein